MMLNIFMCIFSVCVSSLIKCLFRSFGHFLIELFSYCWVLRFLKYLLDINPVLNMRFADIFNRSVLGLFIFLTVSFAEQTFLILMKLIFWIFLFMNCTFGVMSKNSSPNPKSQRFPAVISSKHFTVLHFTFRSVIHFELVFCVRREV